MPIRKSAKVLNVNARALHGARYDAASGFELCISLADFAEKVKLELLEALTQGRVPLNAAKLSLEMALDEIHARMAEESFTWCDNMQSWHGGDRNKME